MACAMTRAMRQIEVKRTEGSSEIHKIVWVSDDRKLLIGDHVNFIGQQEEIFWTIVKLYDCRVDLAAISNVKWGLDLPKSQRTER